jgi:capsular polysaccharide export protein
MITVNSTSGLSAIFHGVTLMVLGRAIYSNPQLAFTTPAFDEFWTSSFVAPAEVRTAYIAWVKQQALKPGDFYCSTGMEVASRSVLDKITETAEAGSVVIAMRAAS